MAGLLKRVHGKQFGVAKTGYSEAVTIHGGNERVHHFLLRIRLDLFSIFMEVKEMSVEGYEFKVKV